MEETTMTNELQRIPAAEVRGAMSLAQLSDVEFETRLTALKKGQERIARIHQQVMVEGVDYGVIPGTKNPTLYQPGADKLCQMYGLVASFDNRIELGDDVSTPAIRVVSRCNVHIGSTDGPVVGVGMGSCNSFERKYRYRKGERACPNCGKPAIIKGKAEFGGGWLCWGKKDGCNSKFKDGDPAIEEQKVGDVLNPDPFDQENTFVKMAAKRAYMDAVLRGTSTHGLFTQDLEDIAEVREPVRVKTVSFDDVDGLHELVKTKTKSKSWEETLKGCKIEAPKGWKEPDGIEQARVLMSWLSVQQADTIRNTILKYKERS